MANKKISELPDATLPLSGAELVEGVQAGINVKIPTSEFGGGTGIESVTGDIVDNTDPLNPIVEVPNIQQVLEQTPRNYSETVGDYTYDLSAFVDEGIEKVFRTSITNNVTGQQNFQVFHTDSGSGGPYNENYVVYPNGSQVAYLVGGYDPDSNNSAFTIQSSRAGVGDIYFGVPFQQVAGAPNVNIRGDLPTGVYEIPVNTRVISANYTAINGEPLTVIANSTITDPTGINGKGYIVYVHSGTATIGGIGYGVGSLVYRFYDAGVWTSKNFDFTGDLALKEDLSNKVTDLTTNDNTHYPTTQAVQSAINTAVTGLLDYRGSYDASTNLFPATGGSGIAGAVLKGDFWICSVAGTLGGVPVTSGDLIIAIVDTPAQTSSNWDLISNELGYQAENTANKTDTMAGNTASSTKYLSAKGVYDYIVSLAYLTIASASATYQAILTETVFGTFLNSLSAKTTPLDADLINIIDTADSNKAKKVTFTNIKAFLKTYFDGLYPNKNRTIFQGKTTLTGVTTYTQIFTMKVDAGLYSATDAFVLNMDLFKSISAANIILRVYIGTTAGATTTQIAQAGLITSNLGAAFIRPFSLNGGNIESSYGGTVTGLSPYPNVNTAGLSTPLNPVNDFWITVTANPSVVSESVGVYSASITPLK